MKGLNKLALAAAVAAAPFATQAMEPMSDEAMGNTTGQAGVTMELDTKIGIDQVAYSQGENTGSVLVNDIDIGGGAFGDSLDIAINVDLVKDGQTPDDVKSGVNPRAIQRGPLNDGDALISLKNIENDGSVPVDAGITIGSMGLQNTDGTESATLVSDLDAELFLSQLDIIARTQDLNGNTGTTGSLGVDVAFGIDNLDVTFDVAAVSLRGMRLAGEGSLGDLKKDGNRGTGSIAANPALVSMNIGPGGAVNSEVDEALRINLNTFQADIWMPEIGIGNADSNGNFASIGSVGIRNLKVTDTTMAIYGRE